MALFKRKTDQPSTSGRNRAAASSGDSQLRRNQAFSYYARRQASDGGDKKRDMSRAALEQVDIRWRARANRLLRSRTSRAAAFLLFLVVVANSIILTQPPAIKVLEAPSSSGRVDLQPLTVYQAAASKLFSQSLANRTKLTISSTAIADKLLAQYPELGMASVSLPLIGYQPTVYIQPVQAALILTTTRGTAFVIDTNGKAILATSGLPSGSLATLPVVTDQSGIAVTIGKPALPSNSVSFITAVYAQLKARHVTVTSGVLPAGSSELDLRVAGQAYLIKFNLTGDPTQAAGTFLAVNERLNAEHVTPGQYIDVRLDGRAYYK